jgi:prepilin-type N-terminal cleavage/methylation domain-containing protein/prepilin-type processing-associated H-X9-DG protein
MRQALLNETTARRRRRGAFTLIELLVVISVITILASLVFPSVRDAMRHSMRADCVNNLRQWGHGLWAYAASNERFFPDNRGGMHTSWVSDTVERFCESYLLEIGDFGEGERMRGRHVVHCPTQQWHRVYGSDYTGPPGTAFSGMGLVGYFYLPHRDPTNCNYTYAGNDWVARRMINSEPTAAPIMTDMKQYHTATGWYDASGTLPWSSHIRSDGEPVGANHLFVDGHVRWYKSEVIELGATTGGWEMYYKIPLDR